MVEKSGMKNTKRANKISYYIYNRNVAKNNIQTVDEQYGYTTN